MTAHHINRHAYQRLQDLLAQTEKDYEKFIGFPGALDFDYSDLSPLLNRLLNNVGDPHVDSFHGLHTKLFEREVIDFCAALFRASKHTYWGYVTNGSTECNLYSLYMAREKLPGAIVYYSQAAHYSIPKNIHMLAMKSEKIHTKPSGEMDYAHLHARMALHSTEPAIIVATVGTTMTEARDNVKAIQKVVEHYGLDAHIHVDAALAGVYSALLTPRHPFDFQDGADSISVSGHKFFGSPIPCGIIVAKKRDQERLGGALNYTGSADTTISGSRNGHSPLFLWYAIQRFGIEGFRQRAREAQHYARYAHDQLQAIGWEVWRNPQALTVMLASPHKDIIHKWQLATHEGWSHIICMPGISKAKIDEFVADLRRINPYGISIK